MRKKTKRPKALEKYWSDPKNRKKMSRKMKKEHGGMPDHLKAYWLKQAAKGKKGLPIEPVSKKEIKKMVPKEKQRFVTNILNSIGKLA